MTEFQRKKRIGRYFYSALAIVILAVIFLVLLRATLNVYQKEKQSSSNLEALTRQYEDLSAKSDYLNSDIQRLSTDRGKDQEIRDKYGVTRNDEKMVVIVEPEQKDGVSTTPTGLSLWQKFVNFFR